MNHRGGTKNLKGGQRILLLLFFYAFLFTNEQKYDKTTSEKIVKKGAKVF